MDIINTMYSCIILLICNLYYYFYRALLKATVIVIPVLGCTWIFGLLAINDNTVTFAWIFTIFNSLQVCTYLYLSTPCIITYHLIFFRVCLSCSFMY